MSFLQNLIKLNIAEFVLSCVICFTGGIFAGVTIALYYL